MIELNLVPKELRKVKRRRKKRQKKEKEAKPQQDFLAPKIPPIPVAVSLLVAVLIAYGLLFFLVSGKESLLKTLEANWVQMEPQRKKTGQIVRGIEKAKKKVMAMRKIAKPDLSWERVLDGLSEALVTGVWLTSFELKYVEVKDKKGKKIGSRPSLVKISGFALGSSGKSTSTVAKFITSLKTNKKFSSYFSVVELENMNNRKIGTENVMMFRLDCRFKEITKVSAAKQKKRAAVKKKLVVPMKKVDPRKS